jgi:iron complex outermembrane receptor protein
MIGTIAGALLAVLAVVAATGRSASAQEGTVVQDERREEAPPPVQPEDQDRDFSSDKDLRGLSLEELMEIEVQTVVSASRYRQKLSEAPSSVTIITAEDIRKFGYRTLADILKSVRGFSTTYDRNYQYVGVRGFGRLGDYNTRILLLVDGHRVNDAIYASAPIGTDFVLDVDLIELIEISRGPGSSLYGSNAFFAVVSIVTRRAKDLKGTELSAEAGSHDALKGRATYGHGASGGTAAVISATGYGSRGGSLYFREFDPQYAFADPRARNGGYAEHCDYDRSRSGYARFERDGFQLAGVYLERVKGVPTASYGTDFNDPGNRTKDLRGYVDLQYDKRMNELADLNVRVYYDEYRYTGDYVYTGTVNRDRAEGAWYGSDVRITSRFLNIHRVIAGIENEASAQQDQYNADVFPAAVYLDDHRRSRSWAAYVQDEIAVSRVLRIYAGVRRDHTSTFGGTTNPRLAAIIAPYERGTFKLLYGSAFRAPSVYELYYAAPPTIQNNPALQPEKIKTYELVYEHDLGNGLRAVASRYSYSIRNLITQTFDALGNSSFQNQERTEATGTEVEFLKSWENGASGRVSYALQKATDPATGGLLSNSPRQLAKMNLVVPLLPDRFFAGIEEQYTGPRFTDAGMRLGGFAVTNLTVLARNRQRTVEASFGIDNLMNKKYADPVSRDLFPLDSVRQEGRTLRAKVTYAF